MELTPVQLKTLGIIGVVTYRRFEVGRELLLLSSSKCTVTLTTLFKHLNVFTECTKNYVRSNGENTKKYQGNNNTKKTTVQKYFIVLRELWIGCCKLGYEILKEAKNL